jgi:hypothetical protein
VPNPRSPPAPSQAVPNTPSELAERFRAVLHGTVTFTVTESGPGAVVMTAPPPPSASPATPEVPLSNRATVGASIVGTLTASGVTGGFDLYMLPGVAGAIPNCEGYDPSTCHVRTFADGAVLRATNLPLEGPAGGVAYQVWLVRPDGVEINLNISNQRSPKGQSELLAQQPPLTLKEMTKIVTSDRW